MVKESSLLVATFVLGLFLASDAFAQRPKLVFGGGDSGPKAVFDQPVESPESYDVNSSDIEYVREAVLSDAREDVLSADELIAQMVEKLELMGYENKIAIEAAKNHLIELNLDQ